jgi:putative acetyltransferase
MPITLEQVDRPTPEVRELVSELEAYLASRYEAHQRHGLSLERIFQPHILFFVAHHDGSAVGCGGVAFDDGFAEVKRMFVRPHARGKGVAQAMLSRFEQEARARSYTRITLETGDVLAAAIRVYERAGFTRCAAFGDYRRLASHHIVRSLFFEKHLSPSKG